MIRRVACWRVGDPCTIDRGESATAAAGMLAMIGWWKGRMARWLGGCRVCELLRILWTAGLCTRLVCLGLGAVWCFPGELAGGRPREGSWLCHPSVMCPAPRGGAGAGVPVAEASGYRVSGAPGSPEPQADVSKMPWASSLNPGRGFLLMSRRSLRGGLKSKPGLPTCVPRQYTSSRERPAFCMFTYFRAGSWTEFLNEARREPIR